MSLNFAHMLRNSLTVLLLLHTPVMACSISFTSAIKASELPVGPEDLLDTMAFMDKQFGQQVWQPDLDKQIKFKLPKYIDSSILLIGVGTTTLPTPTEEVELEVWREYFLAYVGNRLASHLQYGVLRGKAYLIYRDLVFRSHFEASAKNQFTLRVKNTYQADSRYIAVYTYRDRKTQAITRRILALSDTIPDIMPHCGGNYLVDADNDKLHPDN